MFYVITLRLTIHKIVECVAFLDCTFVNQYPNRHCPLVLLCTASCIKQKWSFRSLRTWKTNLTSDFESEIFNLSRFWIKNCSTLEILILIFNRASDFESTVFKLRQNWIETVLKIIFDKKCFQKKTQTDSFHPLMNIKLFCASFKSMVLTR